MDEVRIELEFDQRVQQIVRGIDVVVDGVVLVPVALHRIGGGALFGEMHDRVRAMVRQPVLEQLVVAGQIDQVEMDAAASFGMPDAGALLDRIHRRQRLNTKFRVDPAAREIVEDMDVVAGVGEMKGRWPADETITAEDRNLHARIS
ncbi:hypothetical protein D9M72_480630 [compost metagenome]